MMLAVIEHVAVVNDFYSIVERSECGVKMSVAAVLEQVAKSLLSP